MTEIYWLTRLGTLAAVCGTLAVLSGMALFAALFFNVMATKDNIPEIYRPARKYAKITGFVFVVAMIGTIFIPTQREAMLIYGIGGTIDYIKSNDKAKELPDKCVEALTRYVDSIKKEDNKNN